MPGPACQWRCRTPVSADGVWLEQGLVQVLGEWVNSYCSRLHRWYLGWQGVPHCRGRQHQAAQCSWSVVHLCLVTGSRLQWRGVGRVVPIRVQCPPETFTCLERLIPSSIQVLSNAVLSNRYQVCVKSCRRHRCQDGQSGATGVRGCQLGIVAQTAVTIGYQIFCESM